MSMIDDVKNEIQLVAEKMHAMFGPEVGREVTKAVDEAKTNVAALVEAPEESEKTPNV